MTIFVKSLSPLLLIIWLIDEAMMMKLEEKHKGEKERNKRKKYIQQTKGKTIKKKIRKDRRNYNKIRSFWWTSKGERKVKKISNVLELTKKVTRRTIYIYGTFRFELVLPKLFSRKSQSWTIDELDHEQDGKI